MKLYNKGEKPMVGDIVESIEEDEEYDYTDVVSFVNEDGTINISNGLGVLHECQPKDFNLVARRGDAIELDFQIELNGMSSREFNVKFAQFLKENNLKIL